MVMRNKFLRIPFATDGDKTNIPDPTDPTGAVSFTQGWGPDYQRDQETDPLAKDIDRATMNYLMAVITANIRQYQSEGIPEWISPDDNNGVAFAYDSGITVRYRPTTSDPFVNYISLVTGNTAVPGTDDTKWGLQINQEATVAEAQAATVGNKFISPRRWLDAFLARLVTPVTDPSYASTSSVLGAAPSWVRGVIPTAIATAFQGSNQLLAANGYQKFPGGLIIQWGSALVDAGVFKTVTFPVAFPTACQSVTATIGLATATQNQFNGAGTVTQNSFQIAISSGAGVTVRWIAVGY